MADLTITPGNVKPYDGAVTKAGVAGAVIVAGKCIVRDPTTRKMVLSDSNHATAALREVDGIALNGASDGQPVAWCTGGDIDLGATLVPGTTYALSETAGGIQPTADETTGEQVTLLGVAKAANKLSLKINSSGAVL